MTRSHVFAVLAVSVLVLAGCDDSQKKTNKILSDLTKHFDQQYGRDLPEFPIIQTFFDGNIQRIRVYEDAREYHLFSAGSGSWYLSSDVGGELERPGIGRVSVHGRMFSAHTHDGKELRVIVSGDSVFRIEPSPARDWLP